MPRARGRVASIHRDAEKVYSRKAGFQYYPFSEDAIGNSGAAKSTPGRGKHYQHNDEDKPYNRYCSSDLQGGVWPPDYPPAASSRLSTQTIMLSQIPHFLSIHKYSLYCLEELFSETAALSGPGRDRERIFMPRCIKVPASKLCNRGERAHSPGPNA